MRSEIERRFVVVHVNYSKENKNPGVMERLGNPDKLGFPVLVVLSPSLEVLHAQETGTLETGDPKTPGHDPGRVVAFARAWGPDGEH